MIRIDGVEIPTPSGYLVGIMDIAKTERNARGDMIIERVATKRTLELSWLYLGSGNLQQLLQLVAPVFFAVEFPDPETGIMRTGTFCAGDRSIMTMDFLDGQVRWKDIRLNLVER